MRLFGWLRRKPASTTGAHKDTGDANDAHDDTMIWEGETPYRIIGGRRRKAGIPYLVPWDLEEHNRLDFQHIMLRQALGGNFAVPVRVPLSMLDVGSGTGRWAIEMANLFPEANVIGLDVSPPPVDQVGERGIDMRPPNYSFVAGNVVERLPFDDGSFEFAHMRALVTAIPHDAWPRVIGELARVTAPGGWVESLEVTFLQRGGPAIDQLMAWLDATLARRGVVFMDGGQVGAVMRASELVQVQNHHLAMRCGDAGEEVGRCWRSIGSMC